MSSFKQIILFLIMLPILLVSCGDDDDDNTVTIIGSWRLTTFSLTECDSAPDLVDFGCGNCITNEFESDGTFSSRITIPAVLDSAISGTYTLTGNSLLTCDDDGNNCQTSTIELSEDQLVVIADLVGCTSVQNFERN